MGAGGSGVAAGRDVGAAADAVVPGVGWVAAEGVEGVAGAGTGVRVAGAGVGGACCSLRVTGSWVGTGVDSDSTGLRSGVAGESPQLNAVRATAKDRMRMNGMK